MNALHAIILGIIEGITEFLPISSTGHMILTANLLHLTETDFVKSFEIFIQLGAILAVVILYWKRVLLSWKTFSRVAVAFIPTAVIGLLAYKFVKAHLLGNMHVVLWSLFLGGIFLVVFEYFQKGKTARVNTIESITYTQALWIGIFQAIAIIPGVSRSAATIVGGLALGIARDTIVEFSFMLAIPTMLAATGLDLIKSGFHFSGQETEMLGIGFVVAFISAFFAIKFLLDYVKNHTFVSFGVYRIGISIAFLLYLIY